MPHCPADGGPPWVELVSPHFRLRTDLPRERALQVLRLFEAQLSPVAMIVDSFIPGAEQPGETDLVVFARDEDYRWFMPGSNGAFWVFDERGSPYIAMAEHDATNEAHIIRHELVHRFIYRRLSHEPRWLNEGLAEYAAGEERVCKHLDAIPTVDSIVRAEPATFVSSGYYELGAFMLFRWLADGTAARRAGVRAFIRDIAAGMSAYDAFVARVGNPDALEVGFRAYVDGRASAKPTDATVQSTTTAAPAAAVDLPMEEHPVDEAQLHHLWSRLSQRHALLQLDQMRDHAGDSPLLHWLLARVADSRQDYVTADAELDRAVALAPSEPRWRRERAIMQASRIVSQRVPGTLASVDGELAAIARECDDPRMLNQVAWFYAKSHRAKLGLPIAKRAVAARPEDANLLDTLALLYYETGDTAEALRLQEEAVARLGEIGRVSPGISERLQAYREAAHGR